MTSSLIRKSGEGGRGQPAAAEEALPLPGHEVHRPRGPRRPRHRLEVEGPGREPPGRGHGDGGGPQRYEQ